MAEASAPKLPVATGVLAEDIYVAGVEGGGTSWKVALGKVSPDLRSCKVIEWLEVPTHKPEETLPVINRWLKERQAQFNFVGIGSFGPVQPKRNKPNYGHITATPKVEWKFTDVVGPIMDGLVVPGGAPMPHQFDTDVNAPALGEFLLDGLREEGKSSLAYITVGTGIGVGLVVNDKPVHGLLHPEAGHLCMPLVDFDVDENFVPVKKAMKGATWYPCESYAAKESIQKRFLMLTEKVTTNIKEDVPKDSPIWAMVAHYIGALCASLVLAVSPEKIVLGGGLMNHEGIVPLIRKHCQTFLHGYIPVEEILDDAKLAKYIVRSSRGENAGLTGTLMLAAQARQEHNDRARRAAGGSKSASAL